VSIITYT